MRLLKPLYVERRMQPLKKRHITAWYLLKAFHRARDKQVMEFGESRAQRVTCETLFTVNGAMAASRKSRHTTVN